MSTGLDYSDVPMQQGQKLSDSEKRLNALFDEMDKNQLDFLDQAGKRIIELCTGLLGLIFAVIAFGKDFPPAYLKDSLLTQILVMGVLVLLVAALLCAVLTVQPRKYKFYEHNLTEMRKEWVQLFTYKSSWMRRSNWLFFAGTLLLAVLIGVLIFNS
jgi:hypothetical protein